MTKLRGMQYIKKHEWVQVLDDGIGRIGITFDAQKELGEIIYVELPAVGDYVRSGDGLAVVESVKALADVYAPVSGRIVETNDALMERPGLINEDPYGDGWIVAVKIDPLTESDPIDNRRR